MNTPTKSMEPFFCFAEAWLLLAIARCFLLFLPFRKIVPFMGSSNGEYIKNEPSDSDFSALISLSIKRACRYSPWRTKCFEQALAAKMMFKRRHLNCTIFFGAYKGINDTKLKAHAWLECNGMVVTGGGRLELYTVIGRFTS